MVDNYKIAIDLAPEHAAALGRFVGHWATLESVLLVTLQCLLSVDYKKALFIYEGFNSIIAKLNLLRRLNNAYTQEQMCKDNINIEFDNVEKLNKQRNAFIHSLYISIDNDVIYRRTVKLSKDTNKPMTAIDGFTPQDIQVVVEQVLKVSQSLLDLIGPVLLAQKNNFKNNFMSI